MHLKHSKVEISSLLNGKLFSTKRQIIEILALLNGKIIGTNNQFTETFKCI